MLLSGLPDMHRPINYTQASQNLKSRQLFPAVNWLVHGQDLRSVHGWQGFVNTYLVWLFVLCCSRAQDTDLLSEIG